MTIFSNLLNAYATIDSKHDITGKIVQSASSWLSPGGSNDASTTATTIQTTSSTTTTTTTTQTPAKSRIYNYRGPYQADVVDSNGLPPVKSNVNPSQPLREKPPSEANNLGVNRRLGQLSSVSNADFYSPAPVTEAAAYGPTDFMVETVKLDKAFFHQFFTAKPMLLGTDVVTSTSVQSSRKRGRETSQELPNNLVNNLLNNVHSKTKLQEMAGNYHRVPTTTTTTTTTAPR
jgi:hypothetical protein